MFLRQKYRLRKLGYLGKDYFQVQCFKDWGTDSRDNNRWIGVSRLFNSEEKARHFLTMLENTQALRAANFTVAKKNKNSKKKKS